MSLYKDRIAKGLCGGCGELNEEPSSLCKTCKEKSRKRTEAKRKSRKENNACLDCGKPADNGSRCKGCAAKQSSGQRRRVDQRKEDGLCVQGCGKPVKPGCTMCQEHIDQLSATSSKHYHRRKEAGTCRFCDKARAPGRVLCPYHVKVYHGYRDQTKLEALEAYGGPICAGCSSTDFEVLQIDHINGGGRKHFEAEGITGGYNFYCWLRRHDYPKGFRVLCANCNHKAHKKVPLPNDT